MRYTLRMRPPKASFLLPVHNAASTLMAAAHSVLAQTEPDFELLLIENGSTDSTLSVCQELARLDGRIRVLQLEKANLVEALNHGLQRSNAPIIARMDADDVCHPDRLREQLGLLDANPNVGLASCLVDYGGDRGAQAGYANYVDWLNSLRTHEQIATNRFVESPLAHPSVCFRRDLAARCGTWKDGVFPEDYELWLRWLAAGARMEKVPEPLLTWNDPINRLSRTDARYHSDAFYAVKARYLADWLRRYVSPERKILIWGAGKRSRSRAELLETQGMTISAWIDIDLKKIGNRVNGKPVLASSELASVSDCFVIPYVGNRGARNEISAYLKSRGFQLGRDFILAA